MLNITRISPITSAVKTLELDITMDQYSRWRGGELIQNAMPNLSADDREYIMTGMTPEDWAKLSSD